ncbi:MAG: molybdopterin-dependent oxidoreductase, partial [Rhodobiaceae bacterium]|nr:molybdopterin-dependent oxidoreductase [Rhodobiaceae bacterium]
WCHPVLYQRIAAAKHKRPEMTVVLIDPRRTMTADLADIHLSIAPDGDSALFLGLLDHLAEHGLIDQAYVAAHTTGFDEALARARSARGKVHAATGLAEEEIARLYALFAGTEKVVTVYSQGVNQSAFGTDTVNAIINCHLATGRIGRPGMGPFSVTGQPNAMGGREVGGLANMLAAHMDIENETHRDIVRRFWQSPAIPDRAGLKAVDMFRAVADGRIKAIWIVATNPVVSLPDADAAAAALKSCPFVVVSDVMAETDTTRFAHVKLPSLAWGEKDGTVTNSERRISRQRTFLPVPGEARPDWWQMAEVAERMGFGEAFGWDGPADIFAEYSALTAFENHGTRDLDIGACSGIGPEAYADLAPFQWPKPAEKAEARERFFAEGGFYTADRKGRFVPVELPRKPETQAAYPFVLNTGRVRDHWHTMTRTGKSQRLSAHIAEPFAELHPADAGRLGIGDADIVEIESAWGKARLRALISPRQAEGSVFVPMHWNDRYSALARIDAVVAPVTDPHSGQPASKKTRVSVRKFDAAVFGFAVVASKPEPVATDYWTIGRIAGGWRIEFAHGKPIDDIEAAARAMLALPSDAAFLAYHDRDRGDHRLAVFDGARLLGLVHLSPQPAAVSRSWAIEQLIGTHEDIRSRWRVVAGRPGADMPDKGAIVCSCFSVGDKDIVAAIRAGCTTVDDIGKVTCAGTNCGSCKSEIKGIIDEHRVIAAE